MGGNRMTLEQVQKLGLKFKIMGGKPVLLEVPAVASTPAKKNKYGAVKTNGFDSKHEAKIYEELLLRQHAKEITGIACQVKFQLSVCSYIADFVYYDLQTFTFVVVDAKGVRTPAYRLKAKMMLNELKIKIVEV